MSHTDVVAELARLGDEVERCTRCELHCGTTHGVPGEGPHNATLMLVGEGPGFNEDKQGRPFVGAAGRFLEEMLAVAGLKRTDVYITNVVKHRPPDNRDPQPDELAACRPYLERQIELIDPQVIVTLGRHSLGAFFPGSLISKVHGQVREQGGRVFFNMYHPAAALHQKALRQTLLDDMAKLAGYLEKQGDKPEVSTATSSKQDNGELTASTSAQDEGEPPAQLSLF